VWNAERTARRTEHLRKRTGPASLERPALQRSSFPIRTLVVLIVAVIARVIVPGVNFDVAWEQEREGTPGGTGQLHRCHWGWAGREFAKLPRAFANSKNDVTRWYAVACVANEREFAVAGDILVWKGLGDDTPHSAILTQPAVQEGKIIWTTHPRSGPAGEHNPREAGGGNWLNEAYRRTRLDGAPGVDGQTGEDYTVNLNLQSLLKRGMKKDLHSPSSFSYPATQEISSL